MKTPIAGSNGMASVVPARGEGVRGWRRWAPYAAVVWSLIYAALAVYWAVSRRGFPYAPGPVPGVTGPVAGRFGPVLSWIVVIAEGIPAVVVGAAMLRGVCGRALRPLLMTAGALLTGGLLLLMTGLDLLVLFGYIPYVVRGLLTGAGIGQKYLKDLTQWTTIHQMLCLVGGFLWLAATVCYGRRPERRRLPVLRPPRRPGGAAETEPSSTLGPDRRVCVDGGAILLRIHPLRLGAGVPAGDE